MMTRKRNPRARRGAVAVETAIVYPVFLLFLLGTMVLGLGVFRYGQLSSLAWEGARWASVRGPDYQSSGPDVSQPKSQSAPTDQDVLLNLDEKMLFGLARAQSGDVLTMDEGLTTVSLAYQWKPEYNPTVAPLEGDDPTAPPKRVFDSPIPLVGSARMPTLYFKTDQP